MHNFYNEIFASGFQYKTNDTNKSIRPYKLTLDGNKLKKELFFRYDKEVRNVYHQLNSIYCWDTANKKFIKTNSGWVDNYLSLLRTNKATGPRLRFIFEEYFKKEKGQSTIIYHEDHQSSLTEAERRNTISEVRDGGYIYVVGKTYLFDPKSVIY